MQLKHVRLRWAVLDRDEGLCLCGKIAQAVHHVVHRGRASKKLVWREANMLSLCNSCHDKANSKKAKREHLEYLREEFGYEYVAQPWIGILGEANE